MATSPSAYYREAATVIIAAQTPSIKQSSTSLLTLANKKPLTSKYQVLMLKRNKKSSFLPENYVFPGGTISEADFNPGWKELIEEHNSGMNFKQIVERLRSRHSPAAMFKKRPSSIVPAEVAFRICAIRECFEECGILIIQSLKPGAKLLTGPLSSEDLNSSQWRKRVYNEPGSFLELCKEHQFVPDILSLYEWCNWLTPVTIPVTEPPKKPHRFDTIFYLYCTNTGLPRTRVDNREAVTAQWCRPDEMLNQHKAGELNMIGPQLHELSRLCNFDDVNKLQQFAITREVHGLQRWLPSVLLCQDGAFSIYPGDDLYPEYPDYEGTQPIRTSPKTVEELNNISTLCNRSIRAGGKPQTLVSNIVPACGHIKPVITPYVEQAKL